MGEADTVSCRWGVPCTW